MTASTGAEFSRRVNVELFKDEPLTLEEYAQQNWPGTPGVNAARSDVQLHYRIYLDHFQPYWWHAQSPNGEILTNGEHYTNEDGATNSIEVLFGDDTTMYWAPMYGEDRGFRLLRYGKTDRDHQAL